MLFAGVIRGQVAPACRAVPPCLVGTEWHLCVCVYVCVLSPLSSASLPHKAFDPGSAICTGDNVLRKLAAKPGLAQVCVCRRKAGWLGSAWAHRDLFPPVKDVTSSHAVALCLALSSISISLCRCSLSLFLSPSCAISLCLCPRLPPLSIFR